MRIDMLPGAVGLYPPERGGSWEGMFGGVLPCLEDGYAVIDRVEYAGRQNDQAIRAVVRTVSRQAAEDDVIPVHSLTGNPEQEFGQAPGQEVEPAGGARIATRCPNDPYVDGFQELMVVLAATDRGNSIEGLRVRYEVDGKPYVEDVEWTMAVCGRVSPTAFCRGED